MQSPTSLGTADLDDRRLDPPGEHADRSQVFHLRRVMVGLAWFVLALVGVHTFAERGRAKGSIVLSE